MTSATVVIAVMLTATSVPADWTVAQLTDDSVEQMWLSFDAGQAAWMAENPTYYDIYHWDGATITNRSQTPTHDSYPDVYNGRIVWQDANEDVVYFDGSSPTVISEGGEYEDSYPAIHDSQVTWVSVCFPGQDTFWDIWYWDGSDASSVFTSDYHMPCNPLIADGRVVWDVYVPASDGWDVFYYDGNTDTLTNLTEDDQDDWYPEIRDGLIVWQRERVAAPGGHTDIFYRTYDGATSGFLTDSNDWDDQLPVTDNGQIAWYRQSTTQPSVQEIWFWDGTTATKIADASWVCRVSLDNGCIVWDSYDGNDWEIFAWDGAAVSQLTNNNWDEYSPWVSGGTIAWLGDGSLYDSSTDAEVYTATPEPGTLALLALGAAGLWLRRRRPAGSALTPASRGSREGAQVQGEVCQDGR